jgi:pSer/pThr/pTyr-binding forkhead associated (FHA) protein
MTVGAPGKFLIRWVAGDGSSGSLPLPDGAFTIGRAPTCQIVLADAKASREHAVIEVAGDAITIRDLGSRNGTFVNGERIVSTELEPNDEISVGHSMLHLVSTSPQQERTEILSPESTVLLDTEATVLLRPEPAAPVATPVAAPAPVREPLPLGVVSEDLLQHPIISERELLASGVEVRVAEYAAVGAGLGSFVWVDWLRNSGVPESDIAVVGAEDKPHGRYERLCLNSQIPNHERLRSNSDSCPDNIWGFPGYAVREVWGELKRGRIGAMIPVLWKIFGEPTIADTYTPRSGDVFRSIDKEMARIGWSRMLRKGRIRAIRKSEEGRLVAIVSESDESRRKHFAVSARFLHLAIGYPAIQLLPDLAEYREKYNDRTRVVNAYEEHSHVYEHLRARGGTVLLRGRGIVASRIVQRLWEERRNNTNINIVHLHRSRLTAGHRYGLSRRPIEHEWEFQPFNWPKAAWTGQMRGTLERASHDERKLLLDQWGGTTTADRSDWRRIVNEGLRDGWYRSEYGTVREVAPGQDGKIITRISSNLAGGGVLELAADFVIDCTGVVASPSRSPLLDDLVKTYSLPLNKLGRVQVSNDFEVEGLRHGTAQAFMAGATTLGGPHAAVDSFLGLQYAGLRAMDAMYRYRPRGLKRLNGLYSFAQWLKWAQGVAP